MAVNSVEHSILELPNVKLLKSDKPWSKERLPIVIDRVRGTLKRLTICLLMPTGSMEISVLVIR